MAFDTNQPAHQALRSIVAERTTPLLAWTGSGLSGAAGLPTWPELKTILISTLEEKAETMDRSGAGKARAAAQAAKGEHNAWVAFKMLQEALGKTTYRETIREALAPADTAEIPQVYRDIWSIRARGVLNLNLDRLATRALSEDQPGTALAEFNGRDVARIRTLLNGHRPFIANLHGIHDQVASWVFTTKELGSLLRDSAYASFIELCLSTHTVLFAGLSVDDFAVGGHLERLAALDIEMPPHFWLTNRRDFTIDQWAEEVGIRVIRYTSTGTDHSQVQQFFADLRSYVPQEPTESAPVALSAPSLLAEEHELAPSAELVTWEADDIRRTLNRHAQQLLRVDDPASYQAYEAFSAEYDQAIYRAWYTSTKPGANVLLDYTLKEEVARGAFGRVYSATDPDEEQVAVKVLLEEIRNDPDRLQSFRRGVRSMRILQEREVDGMVAYLEASEIPAFVVMEWIDGPNLVDATHSNYLVDWADLLRVGRELAGIIRRAHGLPERVLHRDVRPSNIMLRGYFADPSDYEVVVLDFDLSWHKGAYERSVLQSTAAGYLAPEQVRSIKGVSTRSGAVDSFGVGMTLFFLAGRQDPLPEQHRHRDWDAEVATACRLPGGSAWRSLPARFARLILACTRDAQSARWDMTEIAGELDRLLGAAVDPTTVSSAELLTEELAAHCGVMADYVWDPDVLCAVQQLPTGMQIEMATDITTQRIRLRISWVSTGMEDRRKLGKYIAASAAATRDQLKAAAWDDIKSSIELQAVRIEASLAAEQVIGRIKEVADGVDNAVQKLRFSD